MEVSGMWSSVVYGDKCYVGEMVWEVNGQQCVGLVVCMSHWYARSVVCEVNGLGASGRSESG